MRPIVAFGHLNFRLNRSRTIQSSNGSGMCLNSILLTTAKRAHRTANG
jgi:hypothetical protein